MMMILIVQTLPGAPLAHPTLERLATDALSYNTPRLGFYNNHEFTNPTAASSPAAAAAATTTRTTTGAAAGAVATTPPVL